jgi:CelD/BcsL family acetyltransferase involved in cellulose biosynthesis
MTRVDLFPAGELPPELADRWAAIQSGSPLHRSPFFHPAFTRLVGAARDDAWVAALAGASGADHVAFLPFQRDRFRAGRAVGWGLNDYQGVIAAPGAEWSPVELIKAAGLRWYQFDHALAEQTELAPFTRARNVSLVVDLSEGFDQYAQARRAAGEKSIERVRSRWRRLERDHGPARFEAHVADPAMLELLFSWKSSQYRRTGMADLLERPWFRSVMEGVYATQGEGFAGLLSVLYAGDRPVAIHLGPRSASVWHYWLPAHDDDPALSRTSPGLLLILAMAQHAEELGLRALDFGRGEARHKREFANSEVALAEGWIGTRSVTAALMRTRWELRDLARRSGIGPRVRRLRHARSEAEGDGSAPPGD